MWSCSQCTFMNQVQSTACESESLQDTNDRVKRLRLEFNLTIPLLTVGVIRVVCEYVRTGPSRPNVNIASTSSSIFTSTSSSLSHKRPRDESEPPAVDEEEDEFDLTVSDSPIYATAAAASPVISSTSVRPPLTSSQSLPIRSTSNSTASQVKLSKEERAAQAAQVKAAKLAAKEELKQDKELQKIVQRACKGTFAEEEIHVVLHDQWRESRYWRLLNGLKENKFSHSFASSIHHSSAASTAAAASSSTSHDAASSIPVSPCSQIPSSIIFHRRPAPSVVEQIRARKRARGAPASEWKTLETEEAHLQQARARDEQRVQEGKAHIVDELPQPPPILTTVALLDGAEFLALHASQQLQSTIDHWLSICSRHHPNQTLLLVCFGIYRLVQMEVNQALQQKRQLSDGTTNISPTIVVTSSISRPKVKPLKKLTDVDALIARIWFQTNGRVRFKIFDDLNESLDWLVTLTSVLSKAPYKETDNVFTLVNTTRTEVSRRRKELDMILILRETSLSLTYVLLSPRSERMRGGDDFSLKPVRGSPSDDDSDDEAGGGQRRKAAKSNLSESWRLYLMQIPRVSERIALVIVKAYPSFQRLWAAYQQCQTDKEREGVLQDLILTSSTVPGVRSTRIGPSISKACYQAIWLQTSSQSSSMVQQSDSQSMDDVDELEG